MQLLVFEFTSFISTFVFLEDSTQLNLNVQEMYLNLFDDFSHPSGIMCLSENRMVSPISAHGLNSMDS